MASTDNHTCGFCGSSMPVSVVHLWHEEIAHSHEQHAIESFDFYLARTQQDLKGKCFADVDKVKCNVTIKQAKFASASKNKMNV